MGSHDITGAINITATTFHGALSGNATTATTLATATRSMALLYRSITHRYHGSRRDF